MMTMHNLHLITIKADNPKDACNDVENEIVQWGNENNWRTITGCIDETGEIFINDNYGRFNPKGTLADIEQMIINWSQYFPYDVTETLVKFRIDEETLN